MFKKLLILVYYKKLDFSVAQKDINKNIVSRNLYEYQMYDKRMEICRYLFIL